jgi:phage terminase large subunit-like protein
VATRRLTRGQRNIAWIEKFCRIPEGKRTGEPVALTKKQKQWIRRIYDTPTRTFILSMGRGNAKTALAAFLLQLHLCGPEAKQNSQLYSAAQSRDQAAIIFDYAAKGIRHSPDINAVVVIRDTAKQIACPELGTLYKALSAEASTAYGLSPAFVVHDELGQVRGPRSELYEALETAQAKQPEPMSIIISTQAPDDIDLLSSLIDRAQDFPDEMFKLELYSAPKDADPFSIESIKAANPHFNDFMNREEVLRQANEAKRLPSRETAYRNLVLNQRVQAISPFVSPDIWKGNGGAPSRLDGATVDGGLDLGAVHDLTALQLVALDGSVHTFAWMPEDGLAEKARLDKVPYDVWKREGHLLTTPGKAQSYDHVAAFMRQIFNRCNVRLLAFDRAYMKFLRPCLERAGFKESELARFVEFGQGYLSMGPAIRELEVQLLEQRLRHGMHPVLTMCAANAAVVTDDVGNRKFTKKKSNGRIDCMVALAMAVSVGAGPKPEEKKFQFFSIGP